MSDGTRRLIIVPFRVGFVACRVPDEAQGVAPLATTLFVIKAVITEHIVIFVGALVSGHRYER